MIRYGLSCEVGKIIVLIFVEEGFIGFFFYYVILMVVLMFGGIGGVLGSIRKEEKKCFLRNLVEIIFC